MNAQCTGLSRQRGATLLVAMVMLIVMTLLGLASIRGTAMQERMGANLYDRSIAFQAVESALREAEASISSTTLASMCSRKGLYHPAGFTGTDCPGRVPAVPFAERWEDEETDWESATGWWATVDDDMKARLGDETPPQYIIEYMGEFDDGTGCSKTRRTDCRGPRYRVTARMVPTAGRPNVMLQSTYRP
jgi:type IV pilus assembly protein PilX